MDIFATRIYTNKLKEDEKSIIEYITKLKKNNKGNKFSNIGWQSENLDTKNKIISPLVKSIEQLAFEYANSLNIKNKLKVGNIWANINGYKDYNRSHIHGGVFSGVYYIKVPKNSGNIVFENPADKLISSFWLLQSPCIVVNNIFTSTTWSFKGEPGLILIFPSFLSHYVECNLNKTKNRVSMSFNLIL